MVNTYLLDRHRDLQESRMSDTAAVLVRSQVREPGGRIVETWTPGPVTFPCRIVIASMNDPVIAGRESSLMTYHVFAPWDVNVSAEARLRVTTSEDGKTRDLRIVGVPDLTTDRASVRITAEDV